MTSTKATPRGASCFDMPFAQIVTFGRSLSPSLFLVVGFARYKSKKARAIPGEKKAWLLDLALVYLLHGPNSSFLPLEIEVADGDVTLAPKLAAA